jgi:VWFA-related protein
MKIQLDDLKNGIHRRDAEDAEDARRKAFNSLRPLRPLRALRVSAVNVPFHIVNLKSNSSALSFLLLAVLLLSFASTAPADSDDGIRADLPLNSQLRVENRRGNISIEVWKEKHVSVTATLEDATPQTRSPINLQRAESLLTISVAPAPTNAPAPVNLILKIPERSRAVVITTSGEVTVRGVPATLIVQTVSGNVRADFPQTSNANVIMEALKGKISPLSVCAPPSARDVLSEHRTQCRFGNSSQLVRLYSESGNVSLATSDAQRESAPTEHTASDNAPPVNVNTPSANSDAPSANNNNTPLINAPPDNSLTGNSTSTSAPASTERKPPTLVGSAAATPKAGTPAPASNEPQEIDEGDIVRVDTQLVTLNMSVVDRGTSRGLVGLVQNDFKIYEDGKEQEIARFDSAAAPFNLVLLIDLSGSTREVVNLIKGAALRFVAAARPSDHIAVITFANTPVIVSRLTSDRDALRQRINAIVEPKGSTKLYDSIGFTMDEILKDVKDSRRNAIVLMSDGLDSTFPNVSGEGSALDYKELLNRVREFDGVFYALWLDTEYEALSPQDVQPETFDLAHDRMKELAEAGGGMFYEVSELSNLAGAYERVVADLGTLYSLSYRPTNNLRDGKWRSIRVNVSRPNAVARGKHGYFAN